jgi:hypothetical protein
MKKNKEKYCWKKINTLSVKNFLKKRRKKCKKKKVEKKKPKKWKKKRKCNTLWITCEIVNSDSPVLWKNNLLLVGDLRWLIPLSRSILLLGYFNDKLI